MKLKIGVLGAGHLGRIHLKCIAEVDQYDLIGFFDADAATSARVAAETGLCAFGSVEELVAAADVVDIVTPTVTHFALAALAIVARKHVFIEKPITHTLAEAESLIALATEYNVKVQVGHVERFNPAVLALEGVVLNPMFVESHRLSMFNPRGTDVPVVHDLMIHDIDLLLSMVSSEVVDVRASGVAVVSTTPDIANARIEFANGCVANLTASRISLKQMRKMRLFQRDAYVSIDFLEKQAQVVRLFAEDDPNLPTDSNLLPLETASGKRMIEISMPEVQPINAIKMELVSLADSILLGLPVRVSAEAGLRALRVAEQIVAAIS